MIVVDTNVFMYAVGREHPLRESARTFFIEQAESGGVLVTSAEVMQELLHAYLPPQRMETLEAVLLLARGRMSRIWPVEFADVELARSLVGRYAALRARDLLHVACCIRRDVNRIMTFDRALAAVFNR